MGSLCVCSVDKGSQIYETVRVAVQVPVAIGAQESELTTEPDRSHNTLLLELKESLQSGQDLLVPRSQDLAFIALGQTPCGEIIFADVALRIYFPTSALSGGKWIGYEFDCD